MNKPWENEPDRKHWIDKQSGLDCLIVRGPAKSLCGYVGIPEGHPWHGLKYDDIDASVHGGLTYSNACGGKICHGLEHSDTIANEHVWWIGFDCAHAGDFSPALHEAMSGIEFPEQMMDAFDLLEVYRTIEYVESQCKKLAKQVKRAAK